MNSGFWPSGVVLLFLGACRGQSPSVDSVPTPSGSGVRVLAFGDSLTAGKGLEDPDRQAYPAVLQRLLREKGVAVEISNAGSSGDTTYDALARLDFSLAESPRVVIVALGSNDTFQGKPLSGIEKNLNAIVRRCRVAGAVVVLCEMRTFPNLGLFYTSDYAKMFGRVARRQGALLAPFFLEGVAGNPAFNLPDGIHPNAVGHERMAQALLPSVEKALQLLREVRP